ncbi:hypothetical protein F183_A09590 [Bryobacterales bacterium F-183]|nr:hypothetical protein F183_A09590 [Bryobacterales bacterium F-183]
MTPVSLSLDELRELMSRERGDTLCLSIYLPTHRRHPENQQDPIRYRNLLRNLEESLLKTHDKGQADLLLEPFRALVEDREFWNHTWEGLAVLGSAGYFRTIPLHRPVPELAIVADSFHIKPLLRILQSADRFQVLRLSRQQVQLFEGNRDHLDEVELDGAVPRTLTEALGEELTEPHLTVTSHGGTALGSAMRHGHGSRADEVGKDMERFFRAVDRPILNLYSRPSGLPLILAALPEHHTPFREVSHNPYLITKGIEIDPAALSVDQLRERAWHVMQHEYRARLRKLSESFEEALSKQLASNDLAEVATAAAHARVETLLVEADRQIPGRLNRDTGAIRMEKLQEPEVDDLLDDLAELVLTRGGKVVVVPATDMPAPTGLAATFRF